MEQQIKYRWIELQFYFLILDLFKLKRNLMDVMDIIDSLSIFGEYNPEEIKQIVQEVLHDPFIKPSREEFVLICKLHKVKIRTIREKASIINRDIYKIIQSDKSDPRMFYNRTQPYKVEKMQTFVDCFNKIRRLGIPC